MREDLNAAFRSLASSRTFTAVALVVLTLGIGATTAIFSVVDAVVLRGLPFDEHDRLVAVGERRPPNPDFPQDPNRDPLALLSAAPQNYIDWAERQDVFESMAAIAGAMFALREPGAEAEELRGQRVSASFFDVLRQRPHIGPGFTADNETEGRDRVAVLSHGLWARRFGSDPAIVGKMIPIEGGPYEVVGVMPPDFAYPAGAVRPTELWVPYVVRADERIRKPNSMSVYLQAVARLKPGVSVEQAQAHMDQISAALTAEHPAWNKGTRAGVRPLHDHVVGTRTAQWMLLLLGAVFIVLIIACANVANLLLARATTREREIGIRAAMGAGRARLLRQLIVESVVLSMIGTALAVLLAWWVVGVLKGSMPEGVPRVAAIALDLRVLGAAAVLSLMVGLLFGVAPALQLSRPDLTTALKEGARGASAGGGKGRIRSALVVVEVALAVILLVGAALFIGSFRELMKIDPGFDPQNVLTLSMVPRLEIGEATVPSVSLPPDHAREVQEVVDRVRQIPGVQAAGAIAGGMPLGGSMSVTQIVIPGRTLERADQGISLRRITPGYHEALGMTLQAGRFFDETDRQGAMPVVIINESAAAKYFPGESAIGKSITVSGARTIVGVVGDIYQSTLETAPRTEAYVPMAQGRIIFSELVVKTSGDPAAVAPAVRSAAVQSMPGVLLRNVTTMDEVISRMTAQRRFNMLLLGLLGLLGLVIATVGVYGVLAYVVAQRTREIGVRMALGATRGAVLAMVLRNATSLVAAGLVLGGIGAWSLSSAAETFVFRMDVNDPRVFGMAVATLAVAAFIASVVPARRAANVDPTVALRAE
jgi:putative ABC transport system permease protein